MSVMQEPLFDEAWCQRWQRRAQSWRHTSEGGFNPERYEVRFIDRPAALGFVVEHHYSGAFSSARYRLGLFDRHAGGELVGVAVYGNGMTPAVLLNPFPHLEPYRQSLELSRLVLLDAVPANAESWFVAQAHARIAEEGVRGVVMYSDPNPRTGPAGALMPGHVGIVYQALGCRYVGASKGRYEDHLPDGTVLPERTASKVRGLERGAAGAVRRLVALGAPDPGDLRALPAPARAEWLATALDAAGARRVKTLGKHRYVLAIGRRRERQATAAAVPLAALPYPKGVAP